MVALSLEQLQIRFLLVGPDLDRSERFLCFRGRHRPRTPPFLPFSNLSFSVDLVVGPFHRIKGVELIDPACVELVHGFDCFACA